MKRKLIKLIILFFMAAPQVGFGANEVSQQTREVIGRLLNATCNWPTGLGDVEVVLPNENNSGLELHLFNVLNNDLCTKGNSGPFSQRLTQMAFASIWGADESTGEKAVRMHSLQINTNNVVVAIHPVPVTEAIRAQYRKLNLLQRNQHAVIDHRTLPAMGAHHFEEKVLDLRQANNATLSK